MSLLAAVLFVILGGLISAILDCTKTVESHPKFFLMGFIVGLFAHVIVSHV